MLLRPHLQQQITGWELLHTACSDLKTVLTNWKLHLTEDVAGANQTRGEGDVSFTVATEDDTSRIIEASFCTVGKWASSLYDRLKSVDVYHPLLLNEYLGEGTSSQCKNDRIKKLKLPCAVKLYTHVHHGDRNLYFIWKLPAKKERTEQQNDQVINQVRDKFQFYSSRATRAHFASLLMKLGMSGPLEGTAARKLLQECFSDVSLEDITTPNCQARLERLTRAMEDGGGDIILDLRKLDFRVNDPMFDTFWDWCAGLIIKVHNIIILQIKVGGGCERARITP